MKIKFIIEGGTNRGVVTSNYPPSLYGSPIFIVTIQVTLEMVLTKHSVNVEFSDPRHRGVLYILLKSYELF